MPVIIYLKVGSGAFKLRTALRCRYNPSMPTFVLPFPSQSPHPAQPAPAYVRLGLEGISSGFLPDLQYSHHSSKDSKPTARTNARAVKKERNLRNRLETLSVPSQCPIPAQ